MLRPRLAIVLALIAALFFNALPAFAAFNGQIRGIVRDADTKKPIASVKITAKSGSGVYHSVTDAHGSFAILGVVPDTYNLSYEADTYSPGNTLGVTVLADSAATVDLTMSHRLKTIVNTHSRSASSAFQPGQTEDSYTVNSNSIQQIQGKEFNTDEDSLLRALPSVTLDRTGTIDIRGGLDFQTSYQFEGIDYTEPNRNLQNPYSNISNFNLLNGVGSVQLIPGGGDATHGNTGTGLVSIRAKRGTYPGFSSIDIESDFFPYYNQVAAEYGIASQNGRFSNYAAYTGVREDFQYGSKGAAGPPIGIYEGNNQIGVYDNGASQDSNDFVDNFFYKFGKNQAKQIQLFYQGQKVVRGLEYNGISNLCYASCSGLFPTPVYLADGTNDYYPTIAPLFPGQTSYQQNVSSGDSITSPFSAAKIEYSDSVNAATFYTARLYRTNDAQTENQPAIGIYVPESGGTRIGTSGELSHQFGENNFVEIGGKFEFNHPYGTNEDFADYNDSFFDTYQGIAQGNGASGALSNVIPPNFIAADFTPASVCGTNGYEVAPGSGPPLAGGYKYVPCGYLSTYFPNGIPPLPPEVDTPVANQQVYGWFVQDTIERKKVKAQLGLRLDGYNFQFDADPSDPPTIGAVAHQRLFEPHVGITDNLSQHNFIRMTFGRTLSIPLPSQFGNDISRSSLSAFANIPSYDNSTGLPATYCGLNQSTQCASYADQLYWIYRDAKFGGNQLSSPLVGATFTNWDLTFGHEFRNGMALNITPYYRRGYNIVEESTSIIGVSETTGLAITGPLLYSNLGIQKTTGVEMLLTSEAHHGFSYQISGTYINQLGNDPPGTYLPTASLDLGNLYRSDLFSPLQLSFSGTYRANGWKINPMLTYNHGYPYGVGTMTQVLINGVAYNVPNTNIAQLVGAGASLPVADYVDPQNPGTRIQPNIIGNNGLTGSSSAGSLLSNSNVNLDTTFEFTPPHAPRYTIGLALTNIFSQLYGIPVTNPRYVYPISTGVFGYGTGVKSPFASPNDQSPPVFASNAFPDDPYLIFPRNPQAAARLYLQIKV